MVDEMKRKAMAHGRSRDRSYRFATLNPPHVQGRLP